LERFAQFVFNNLAFATANIKRKHLERFAQFVFNIPSLSLIVQFPARASAMIQNGNEVVAFGRICVVGTQLTFGPIAWLQVNGGSRNGSLWHGLPLMVGIATLALVLTLQCRTRIGSPELALVVRQKIVCQATRETISIEIPIITAINNILTVIAEAAKIAPRITAGLTRSVNRGGVHIPITWLSVDRSGSRNVRSSVTRHLPNT